MDDSTAKAGGKTIKRDGDQTLGRWHGVVVVVWHVNTTMGGVKALDWLTETVARDNASGIGLMTIVEESAPVPSSDVRTALAAYLAKHGSEIKASAVVHEGSGFRAALVRSFVTGLNMLARQPFPHKVFATVADAAAWLTPQLPEPVKAEDLATAIKDMRASSMAA